MKKWLLAILSMLTVAKPVLAMPAMPAMQGLYGELGLGPFPLPIPVIGLGFREQYGHYGYDLSLKASTVIEVTHLKASVLAHYYFKPCLASQFYTGFGLSAGTLFLHHADSAAFLASPEFVFGKQYRTETGGLRFFQAQASFPTFAWDGGGIRNDYDSNVLYMPMVVLSYGVIF